MIDPNIPIALSTALGLISLGGGLYEGLVLDPRWPLKPELIQPARGGVLRRRFWVPAHIAFEISLLVTFVMAWSSDSISEWLWVALASHLSMRLWSALHFIPQALAFERADLLTLDREALRRWTRLSRWRLALDLLTCSSMLTALVTSAKQG